VPVDVTHLEVLVVPAERAVERCHADTLRSGAGRRPDVDVEEPAPLAASS
jgi:hypothetical protein